MTKGSHTKAEEFAISRSELSETDKLEIWLVLNLIEHAIDADKPKLYRQAADLIYRLKREHKLSDD